MSSLLNWGILSTGRIADEFAADLARSERCKVVAVGSRKIEPAQRFAATHGILHAHGSYEELLANPEVHAIYVATPHPQHREWTLKAIAAGKHVLCEKPLALSVAHGVEMVAAARAKGVLLMEAFMYRCTPQTVKIVELVSSGALGRIGMVQVSFGISKPFDLAARLWSRELGGGAIVDLGCYPVSFARLIAGAAAGKAFLDPVTFHGAGEIHPQAGVDVYAGACAQFENGMVALLSTGMALQQEVSARIYGSHGWLHVPAPWHPARAGGQSSLWLHRPGASAPEEIVVKSPLPIYAVEADAFASALERGLKEVPEMTLDDTLGNLATLERWLMAVGMKY